jgi:cytochrome c oxidase assembly protein subunit 15
MVDPRRWMRRLGLAAVGLVILQGVLGGLRVVWVSLDLAMVHACVAQLFFALLVAMTLFTTRTWREGRGILPAGSDATGRLRRLAGVTTIAIYLQIVLGALLRHPGRGVDGAFATIHIAGAFAVVGLAVAVFVVAYKHFDDVPAVRTAGAVLLGTVGVQFALGLAAFAIMLYDLNQGVRSVLQVGLTIGHLVVGSVLFASAVVTTLLVRRRTAPETAAASVQPAGGDAVGRPARQPEPSLASADD